MNLLKTESQLHARERILKAYEDLEAAKALLGSALGGISRVVGLAPDFERIGLLYDQIADEAQKMDLKIEVGFDLDPETKAKIRVQ